MPPREPKRVLGNFVVEPGVPIPTQRAGSFRYPFPAMAIGDSFLLPQTDGEDRARNAYRAARLWGARQEPSRRFSIRRVPDGWRLWRTE
jgi:hypothetical protein